MDEIVFVFSVHRNVKLGKSTSVTLILIRTKYIFFLVQIVHQAYKKILTTSILQSTFKCKRLILVIAS